MEIKLVHVTKSFGAKQVIQPTSFVIQSGSLTTLLGPSGCGKSTLLNILGLLDNPTEGSYKLIDKEVAGLKEKERTQLRKGVIGFVFQSFNLIDELNVFENVELPLTYLGIKASERKERVLEILKRMNLSHRAKHFPQQLSGGQQQRVAIARALVNSPAVLLADEPSGNLDTRNKEEVHRLFFDLRERLGQTIVLVTHDESLALRADRRIVMSDGLILPE